jgi:hypothetical protein
MGYFHGRTPASPASWRRRSGAYRGARRRRRRRCGARGRVHREARLTGEGLASAKGSMAGLMFIYRL